MIQIIIGPRPYNIFNDIDDYTMFYNMMIDLAHSKYRTKLYYFPSDIYTLDYKFMIPAPSEKFYSMIGLYKEVI